MCLVPTPLHICGHVSNADLRDLQYKKECVFKKFTTEPECDLEPRRVLSECLCETCEAEKEETDQKRSSELRVLENQGIPTNMAKKRHDQNDSRLAEERSARFARVQLAWNAEESQEGQ